MGWDLPAALVWLDDHVSLEAALAAPTPPTLERISRLMVVMGDPQSAYPVIHLTGTNGKGSTARMITALLAARGLSVGTYTSPDLERVNERLAWNGEPIGDAALAETLEAVAAVEPLGCGRLSRFEALTAAAYRWFADLAVDVAVVEVGLGGRWDATNVVDAAVAVVTNVSLDHADVLGSTVVEIAAEKAGIVKPGSTLVLGETDDAAARVFEAAGAARTWRRDREFATTANDVSHGGRLVSVRTPGAEYGDVHLPVHGAHQGDNAAAALAAAEAFFEAPLADAVVAEAFAGLRLPGRMEVMGRHPLVLLDGAHNAAGARAAGRTLDEEFAAARSRVYVAGMLRGRDPGALLAALGAGPGTVVVACPAPSPRTLPAAALAAAAGALGAEAHEAGSVPDAVAQAIGGAGADDLVLVTGSLYVVGAARAALTAGAGRGADR